MVLNAFKNRIIPLQPAEYKCNPGVLASVAKVSHLSSHFNFYANTSKGRKYLLYK